MLGKQPVQDGPLHNSSIFDASKMVEDEAQSLKKDNENPEQILGLFDMKFKRFEILLESTDKIKLKSKCVDKKTRDVIFLSTQ